MAILRVRIIALTRCARASTAAPVLRTKRPETSQGIGGENERHGREGGREPGDRSAYSRLAGWLCSCANAHLLDSTGDADYTTSFAEAALAA